MRFKSLHRVSDMVISLAAIATMLALACTDATMSAEPGGPAKLTAGRMSPAHLAQGQEIFRFETFGDESFWTDTLALHREIQASLTPAMALQLGLKVDVEALPPEIQAGIRDGTVKLDAPATTIALLGLNAVVGVKGVVDAEGNLTRVGVTCALCHSTVDNSFDAGIGRRLDGWPNRDLKVGSIVALSKAITAEQRAVYESWPAGRYDPRFNQDGKNLPVVLPPAFGLRHVARELYTGDDEVSYWNAYVAITQMHGHGRFNDPRIGVNVNNPPDLVSSKLDALRAYQFSLATPEPAPGSFDAAAARRGRAVFNAKARCADCHIGATLTDINAGRLYTAEEVGQDGAYAERSVTKRFRTTPLRGLWNPPQLKGPYFHDGSAATLEDVVQHYVELKGLPLTTRERADLVEYLKSL